MQRTHIKPERLRGIITDYIHRWETKSWDASDIPWSQIQMERLTDAHRSAVRFVTLIEDHIPWYLHALLAQFPIDESVSPEQVMHNREAFRFFVRWAHEEDRHAETFCRYQLAAGIQSEEALRAELTREAPKTWAFPQDLPVQIFTYTTIQEKATQIYYAMLRRAVAEPVLKGILNQIQKDEAKHFALYANILQAYVEDLGQEAIPAIQEALQAFKMPLAEQLENYWRWSLEISDTAGGYDHTVAFEDLVRVVNRAAGAPSWSQTMGEWVQAVRAA